MARISRDSRAMIQVSKFSAIVNVDVPADSCVRRLDQSTSHAMAERVFPHGGHGCPPVRK